MANKKSPLRWIIPIAAIVFLGILVYSTMQATRTRYEVCMNFKGGTHCATASGTNYDQAVRSAQTIDCELLSNGRDENMVCLDTQPASVHTVK